MLDWGDAGPGVAELGDAGHAGASVCAGEATAGAGESTAGAGEATSGAGEATAGAGEATAGAEGWRGVLGGLLERADGPPNIHIDSFASRLALRGGLEELTGPELIDRLASLERLRSAAAAEQSRVQARFATLCESGLDDHCLSGPGRVGRDAARARQRSAAAQIALARKISPSRGARLLAMSRRLVADMPCTLEALGAGHINEDRALMLAEGVEVLSSANRSAVDLDLCSDPRRLEGLGDRGVQDAVRSCVDAIDDGAALARARRAESGRRVTIRRLPDSMAQLTAILPVAQAAAIGGALKRASAEARAAGDSRTGSQVAADALVERVTGQAQADAVPLRVGLVMTDASLFGEGREPALLQGYGTIPAGQARRMVADGSSGSPPASGDAGTFGAAALAGVWLRRLYLSPSTGELAAMDAKSRRFPRALADFVAVRDQVCRTPFCDAPIRHIDHVVPFVEGGETSAENGQGLCEACNYVKESPGWEHAVVGLGGDDGGCEGDGDEARGDIRTVTPTGHDYYSPPLRLPGSAKLPPVRRLPRAG